MTYRRKTGSPAPKRPDGTRANKYAGPCHYCGANVPAGHGNLVTRDGAWTVMHRAPTWHGSPVSGRYIGGCPGDADKLNQRGGFAREITERDATPGTGPARREPTWKQRYGRCEDAPCCGCCD